MVGGKKVQIKGEIVILEQIDSIKSASHQLANYNIQVSPRSLKHGMIDICAWKGLNHIFSSGQIWF